jgi:hypothetical protein
MLERKRERCQTSKAKCNIFPRFNAIYGACIGLRQVNLAWTSLTCIGQALCLGKLSVRPELSLYEYGMPVYCNAYAGSMLLAALRIPIFAFLHMLSANCRGLT